MPLPTVGQVITILPVAPATEKRQGICKFVGETQFSDGLWVGVELIGSQGKNNGSVNGVQYFTCEPGKGVFIRPELVEERSSETTLHDAESSKQTEELRSQLEEVTKQLSEKEELLSTTKVKLESTELDLEIALEETAAAKEDMELAQQELEEIKLRTDPSGELKRRAEETDAENQRLVAENEELRELAEAEAKSTEIIENLTDIKLELEEKNEALLEQLQKLRADYDELQTLSTMQDEELAEQREELQLHGEEVDLINARNQEEIEEKNKEYMILKAQLIKLESDLEDLKTTSSGSQQELAVQLRRLKEQNADITFRVEWDQAVTQSLNARFEDKAALSAIMQSTVPQLTTPLAQASAFMLKQHATTLVDALVSQKIAEVRKPHHVEAAVALGVFHMKLNQSASGFGLNPLTASEVGELENILLQDLVAAGQGSSQGSERWKRSFIRLGEISLPKPDKSSDTVTRSGFGTAQGAKPLLKVLHFMLDIGQGAIEDITTIVSTHLQGVDEANPAELEALLKNMSTTLASTHDPLVGVEKVFERVGGQNLIWNSEATEVLLLAVAEAHTLILPLLQVVEKCQEVLDSVQRGLTSTFWSSNSSQIFTTLKATAAKVEGSFLSPQVWLPTVEAGLSLKSIGSTVAAGLKKLWNILDTSPQISPPRDSESCSSIEPFSELLQEALKEVQQAEGALSAEQAKEAVAEVQKVLDNTTAMKDKALYEVEAQRARCKELETHVSRLKKSEADLTKKLDKVEKDSKEAFNVVNDENIRLLDEVKKQKKAVQQASSVAPMSQWERRQMKHTIEVYRAAAQSNCTTNGVSEAGSTLLAAAAAGRDGGRDFTLQEPVPRAVLQQTLSSSAALQWSTPAGSLQLVGV